MLESYVRARLKEKEILLMTHIVAGYPTFEDSFRVVETMVEAGVDLMELQIPFSEPIADGPVILHANQKALAGGATVRKCLELAGKLRQSFEIPLLFMSYYNILFKYGVDRFAAVAKDRVRGAIVPDLPPEEGANYLKAMEHNGLAPIFIFSPTTTNERMKQIASLAGGFIYCVARKGVTGLDTNFAGQIEAYLARCRRATHLPLALGFGVKGKADVDFLKGKADIVVIGSETIRWIDEHGIEAVGPFIRALR